MLEAVFISLTDHWKEISLIVAAVAYIHTRFTSVARVKDIMKKMTLECQILHTASLDKKLDEFVTEEMFVTKLDHLEEIVETKLGHVGNSIEEIKDHLRESSGGKLQTSKSKQVHR